MFGLTFYVSMVAIYDIVIAICGIIKNIFDTYCAGWTMTLVFSKLYSHPLVSFFKIFDIKGTESKT